jgi:DNA mismatch endonuclease, patch repair protein
MADTLTPERRSENMRRIKSKGMKPELAVRQLAHRLGYRYRLHRKDLPGKPDLVFGPAHKAIFVHGCFWHGHDDPACRDGRAPRSNQSYWLPKLTRNKGRDAASVAALKAAGWHVLVVWECETRDAAVLRTRLEAFLGPRPQKRGNTDASREKAREAGNASRDGSAKSIISAA